MTVGDLIQFFSDGDMFPDPEQKVRFTFSPKDVSLEKGTAIEMRGSTVPEQGEAVVAFRPVPKRKYMFSLKFEANPAIEAESLGEAEKKAFELMRHRAVVDVCTGDGDEGYVAREPCFMEEVEE